jgi:ADP-ribose pyrophosphatase YjhB (NUDIX family)
MLKANPNSKTFRFCPRCGQTPLESRSEDAFGCARCDCEFYLNPAAAVAALIIRPPKELLIVKRSQDPAKGTWDLPGGFCKAGESAEEGLRREIREELGLEILSMRYFCSAPNHYFYKDILYSTIDLAYLCEVDQGAPIHPNIEIERIEYIPFEKLKASKFGLSSIQRIVRNFIGYQNAEGFENPQ